MSTSSLTLLSPSYLPLPVSPFNHIPVKHPPPACNITSDRQQAGRPRSTTSEELCMTLMIVKWGQFMATGKRVCVVMRRRNPVEGSASGLLPQCPSITRTSTVWHNLQWSWMKLSLGARTNCQGQTAAFDLTKGRWYRPQHCAGTLNAAEGTCGGNSGWSSVILSNS